MRIVARILLIVSLVCIPSGKARAAIPTKPEVMEAIQVLEKSVTGPDARAAAKTIVVFAQLSDDVVVNIGDQQLPWLSEKWNLGKETEKECESMLVAAYVAGNVRSQLRTAHPGDDTCAGWIFAIDVYRRLKLHVGFTSPALESLSKMQASGTLERHAKEIVEDPEESEGAPKRPAA